MDISTASWFNYLHEEVLTEGLRDIGLPEQIIDWIENIMPDSPEKSKMYVGNMWKKTTMTRYAMGQAKRYWDGFMERSFKDQIQPVPPEDRSPGSAESFRPRTMTPYYVGGVDDKPVVRKEYDDETIEQNKRIAFVAQNVGAALTKPYGTWRKAFMKATKALSKAGLPSETVESVKEELTSTIFREFKTWWNEYDLLFSWLNDEPTNYELIKGEDDINTAYNIAKEDLETREDPDNVLHQFDDGYYWYDLATSNCSVEAERMGHCGSDSRGSLISLRMRKEKRKASSSFITMTYEASSTGGTLYQIKGRENNAPEEELWGYIDWFIKNAPISYVAETGEHSNDLSGFAEMNEALKEDNPDVDFDGLLDVDAIDEAVQEVVNNYQGDYTGIYAEVQDPQDWGGDGQTAYIYISAEMSFEVDLGWPGIVRRDNDYYSADEADSGDINELLDSIPFDSYGREARDFVSEIGLDDLGYELPGEDAEVEYEVVMLMGVQPDDVPAGSERQTAHLRVNIRSNEPQSADNADDAASEVEFVARELERLEESIPDYIQAVRSQLVDGEYIAKGAYDRTRGDMVDKTFEHWSVHEGSGGSLEFAWRGDASQNVINAGGQIPQVIQMYGQDYDRNITELYTRIFGSPMSNTSPPRLENVDLNRNMARNLENLYQAKQENPDQQQMKFGPEYAAKAARIILAKDSHFIIQGSNSAVGQNSKYPTQPIGWMYKINMNYKTSEAEIQVTQDILDFFNENPEMMNQAAQKTIQDALSGILALAQARKDDISSGRQPFAQIRQIENLYTPVEDTADGMKAMMIARWINQNFEQMDEVEKYVSYYKYLRPIVGQQIRRIGPIDHLGDDKGKPDYFDQEVRAQLIKMGATSSQMNSRNQDPIRGRMGEPRPAQENKRTWNSDAERDSLIEEALSLIRERDVSYDLRIYQVLIRCSMSKQRGGQRGETETEIRGIDGVTVVSGVTYREDPQNWYSTLKIKFELLGRQSRDDYMKLVLLPSLLKIKGLKITPGGISNAELISKEVNEVAGFGGMTAGAANAPRQGPFVPTPKPAIQDLIDAWVSSGERVYDIPTDNNEMSYHTMVNVEELWDLVTSPFYRNTTKEFDNVKKNIINHGTYNPIVVAIGKNGRAKINSGIDIVFAAKDLGLQELPTIFMYQHQV